MKLTVRAMNPYDAVWAPSVDAGVTPVAVITWARNGIERLTLEPTGPDMLASDDWRLRAQTLQDVADGTLELPASLVAPLADDPQVLVRHRAMRALGKLGEPDVIERGLSDEQSCVRIAAALALGQAGGGRCALPTQAGLRRGAGSSRGGRRSHADREIGRAHV